MPKIATNIEIVTSTVPGLSSLGLDSRRGIQAVLAPHCQTVRITIINNLADLRALVARRPDLVFLGMKFIPLHAELGQYDPEKIWISEYLEQHGITHTGSDYKAHELELHKQLAKQYVLNAGLSTARFYVARQNEWLAPSDIALSYPVFIKPTSRGGGLGVDDASMAHNFSQLRAKVQSLADKYQSDALIEEYLPGREFSVGLLRDVTTGEYSAMPLELVAPADDAGERFLTNQIKSADTEEHFPVTEPLLRSKLNALALEVFHALGARDYGRIDIRLDAAGTPHFLEANLLPSLLDSYGNFPKTCLLNLNLKYEPMILQIVTLALSRDALADDSSEIDSLPTDLLGVPFVAVPEPS